MTTTTAPHAAARRWPLHLVLGAGAVAMIYPLVWLVASSFKPSEDIFTDPVPWPTSVDLSNYSAGWEGAGVVPFHTFLLNSLIVCAGAVVGNVLACSLTAYAFARLDFRFRSFAFAVMLVTIMLPHHATLIPQYIAFLNFGWVDTYLPLIVPKLFATDAFFIFLMVQFIRTIPRELDQAAQLDGCSQFGIYWRVILPLMRPALVTTAIFTFIWTYDDFLSQLIYLSDPFLATVPLGLRTFLDSGGDNAWGPMFSMSVIALLPTFLFFVVFQRQLVNGISTSGMKG